MTQAAASTTVPETDKSFPPLAATIHPPPSLWKTLESSRQTQLAQRLAELIRRVWVTKATSPEGGCDESL